MRDGNYQLKCVIDVKCRVEIMNVVKCCYQICRRCEMTRSLEVWPCSKPKSLGVAKPICEGATASMIAVSVILK